MRRLLTPAWLAGHTLVWVGVAVCCAFGWWQAGRALSGNTLSWAYTFEWPLFAVFILFLWVKEMRLTLRGSAPAERAPAPSSGSRREPVVTRRTAAYDYAAEDPQLAAYNEYLAWLSEHPEAKPSAYPGSKELVK